MIIRPKGQLTESSFDRKFFSKNGHLTNCSHSIRIVHVRNFFVTAARRRERIKLFLYCYYYYFNRVHRKKLAPVVAANQVFVVVTKSTGTTSTVSASAKLAARVVANIMPLNVAELAAVLAANSNDVVTIYAVVATWIRNQDGHLFYQASRIFFRCREYE
jgi:hypothetical protein